ncbi:hypothetical protein [Inquilinus limosus]|uniref:Uncharacterized protein n=1 Tax=Inquilinus limosus MP06 TaxID=1398085 RepID=A0A0A0DDZ6_9PROT|nr:hypothetical protein [Inquilinus limosus]KGM36123.1 hypothetical protein P409_00305 [Inquilinus limosus MP06]
MIDYAVYDSATGRILIVGQCREEDVPLQAGGYPGGISVAVSSRLSYRDHYMVEGQIANRPVLPIFDKMEIAADGVDEATLVGLPDPCRVIVDDVEHVVEGGSLSIASPMPATYVVEIKQWPYKDARYEIVAH